MSESVRLRPIAYAGLAALAAASAGVVCLLLTSAGQTRVVDGSSVAIGSLAASAVFLCLAWLILWHQSRALETHRRQSGDQQQKLDTAISHMSQGLVMFDAAGRVVLCNRRYLELYGLPSDFVQPGMSLRDLLLRRQESGSFFGDLDEYHAGIVGAIAEGKSTTILTEGRNGRLVQVVNTPLADGGWVATHEDITERQQLLDSQSRAEEDVREQKRRLDAALENISQGLCMHDPDGRIVLFNRRYRELMGEDEETLHASTMLEALRLRKARGQFPDDPDEFFAATLANVRAGKITISETQKPNGVILRVLHHPMQSGGWVATFEDVTEQRRAERERDRNRAFLDLIIENAPSIIFVKRASDRKYVLVNRAAERFWGIPRHLLVGRTSKEVFPEAEAENIEARDTELLQTGEPVFEEREIVTRRDGLRSVFSRRLMLKDQRDQAQYILGVVDDVSERKFAEARIAHLAHYDPLTQLPNRTLFREQLEKELSFVQRGAQLAVLYLDLDHFKSINDTLGHSVGDELLKEVAQRLRGCLRDNDLIARLGGDEFAIVRTSLEEPEEAEALAQCLRQAVTRSVYDLNGHQTTTDLSIGIALAPGDGHAIDDLLKHADLALYGAKAEGRASYRYYEPEMNARMRRRRALETDLRSAVANGEFALHYQPIIDLRSGRITSCEALLRWSHPERGVVPPQEFVPIAEDTGLINAIGEWVLRRACTDAMAWPKHVRVAVNVSPVQFRNPTLGLAIVTSLRESGLPPQRLEIEITESALMQNNEPTMAVLRSLHDLGVRISMDDFGTGFSSLSYLRSFPFEKIKIDRCFINDLGRAAEAAPLVQAIVNLAKTLRMTTTAEGVETSDQERILRAAGCDEMQGYLHGPPQSVSAIAEFIRTRTRAIKVA